MLEPSPGQCALDRVGSIYRLQIRNFVFMVLWLLVAIVL